MELWVPGLTLRGLTAPREAGVCLGATPGGGLCWPPVAPSRGTAITSRRRKGVRMCILPIPLSDSGLRRPRQHVRGTLTLKWKGGGGSVPNTKCCLLLHSRGCSRDSAAGGRPSSGVSGAPGSARDPERPAGGALQAGHWGSGPRRQCGGPSWDVGIVLFSAAFALQKLLRCRKAPGNSCEVVRLGKRPVHRRMLRGRSPHPWAGGRARARVAPS